MAFDLDQDGIAELAPPTSLRRSNSDFGQLMSNLGSCSQPFLSLLSPKVGDRRSRGMQEAGPTLAAPWERRVTVRVKPPPVPLEDRLPQARTGRIGAGRVGEAA